MKILQLRFKNLNSLVGEWMIDFTLPEYMLDGIFAISGPTGAGKSTILDAICLALYGCTPRLQNISGANNEIMSRQMGECFAEVVFESHEGSFRAYWSQRRARGKADGSLQSPQHELSRLSTGELLASQIKATREQVEQKTGMDFNRFTQSMMLAQGGFAAFLSASGSERAPILEQITGTEIYSQISMHIFDRRRLEANALDQLKAESKGITILNPDEMESIRMDLQNKSDQKELYTERKEILSSAITWVKTLETLTSGISEINQEEILLINEEEGFAPNRLCFENAVRAANLDGEYASLLALRKQQKEDLDSLTRLSLLTPEISKLKETAQTDFDNADKMFVNAKNANDTILKLTILVRILDQEIFQSNKRITDIKNDIIALNEDKERLTGKIESYLQAIVLLNSEAESVNNYLTANNGDSSLVTELTGIKVEIKGVSESKQTLIDALERLNIVRKSLEFNKMELQEIEKELEQVKEKLIFNQNNSILVNDDILKLLDGKTVDEIQIRKDLLILHLAELQKIANFDTERKRLEDGKECPLCGSVHHPWAEGNIPNPDEAEIELTGLLNIINQVEKLTGQLEKLQKTESETAAQFAKIQSKLGLTVQQQKFSEETIINLSAEVNKFQSTFNERSESLNSLLEKFGITNLSLTSQGTNRLISLLTARKEMWEKQVKRNIIIEEELKSKNGDIYTCEVLSKSKDDDIKARTNEMDELITGLNTKVTERQSLFGEKVVDKEEEKSKTVLKKTEIVKSTAQINLQKCVQNLSDNLSLVSGLRSTIAGRHIDLEDCEKNFVEHIIEYGFANEADFISCRMSISEREKLDFQIKLIDKKKIELNTRKIDKEEHLKVETAKKLTDKPLVELSLLFAEANEHLTNLTENIGALNERLTLNEDTFIKGEKIRKRIETQQKVFDRWNNLNNLIGSADGKKYRNFAQGLTLEIMVSFANNQLSNLSDRYLLIRDKNEPLELNVIDNFQAGEIRSTKNLSGGESFIVSLALALGLSQMSSKNVKVDSLFLDEGFGTLDEETLETALGTLANLRQEGKMIGIISHVGALKDRISTKIIVQPIREGRSVLSGPGCYRI